jgi:signal peptidase I
MFFGAAILIASLVAGAGRNIMRLHPSQAAHSLWGVGVVVICGELIRYAVIKNARGRERAIIITALTIALATGHMGGIRMFIAGNAELSRVLFEFVFLPLMISAAASYFAVQGSLAPIITVSFVYTMAPLLLPILPNVTQLVWTLMVSGILFLTLVIYRLISNEKIRGMKIREKRMAKYTEKNPIPGYLLTVAAMGVIIAFFAGAFPIYPVVILTGSMTGSYDRGSMVFVERVPHGEALDRVEHGDAIHFLSRGRVAFIHRVIDFLYDEQDVREYVTKGDANERSDPNPVPQDDVLGIVRGHIPHAGQPYLFVRGLLRSS